VETRELGIGPAPVVAILVNGRGLEDLARAVEQTFADAEGNPDLAGSYAGLSPELVTAGSRHFLGVPQEVWFDDGDTVLLGCICATRAAGP